MFFLAANEHVYAQEDVYLCIEAPKTFGIIVSTPFFGKIVHEYFKGGVD